MSEGARVLKLEVADLMAAAIIEKLSPHCERIETAGSIRRRRGYVGDIDLVAIPKMTSKFTMFCADDVTETDFADAVRKLIVPENFGQKILRGATRVSFAGSSAPVSVDIYIATPETWATILLIRTGSADHNIWMCSRARAYGGMLHADGSGLEVPGQVDPVMKQQLNRKIIRAEREEEIFSAMGFSMPRPEEREMRDGKPVWMGGRTR